MKKIGVFKKCDLRKKVEDEKQKSVSRQRKRAVAVFALINIFVFLTVVLFPLYCDYMWYGEGSDYRGCLFMRVFKLYCPFCGITRSLWYLMKFDIVSSFVFSPFALAAVAAFVYCDVKAFVSLINGKERIVYINPWISRTLVATLLLTFVVRNVLLVFCGYDPLGNIGEFWKCIF